MPSYQYVDYIEPYLFVHNPSPAYYSHVWEELGGVKKEGDPEESEPLPNRVRVVTRRRADQ